MPHTFKINVTYTVTGIVCVVANTIGEACRRVREDGTIPPHFSDDSAGFQTEGCVVINSGLLPHDNDDLDTNFYEVVTVIEEGKELVTDFFTSEHNDLDTGFKGPHHEDVPVSLGSNQYIRRLEGPGD